MGQSENFGVPDLNDLGEVELQLREIGIPVPASVLSEGTLRILGMLAYL